MSLIEVERLTKNYRRVKQRDGLKGALLNLIHRQHEVICAVESISFSINPGELVGYIGPNGAGKSTTIKMLTGILIPSSGSIQVNGFVPYRERHRYTHHIGVVFGQRTQLWWDIPVIESFKLLRKIYHVSLADYERRLARFIALLELESLLTTPARKLSLGQRMRCDLVASMLHNPRILFLDEPTIGLDLIGKQRIRDFLRQINHEEGITMILTTHDLKEIEALCKRLIIIDHGKIIFDGQLDTLRKNYQFDRHLIFQLDHSLNLQELQDKLELNGSVQWQELDSLHFKLTFKTEKHNPAHLIDRILRHASVNDITIEEPSIDDIVGRIYSNL